MRFKFILLILLSYFSLSFAQNSKEIHSIDSLWTIVSNKNAYAEKGSKEMLRLCTEMYYQAKSTGYDTGQLRSIIKSSEIYLNEQNYSEALKRIPEGIELAEKTNDYEGWSNLLLFQGNINSALGYFKKAKTSFQKALLITDKISVNDKKYTTKSLIYFQIGCNIDNEDKIESNKIKYDSIISYFHKAHEESKKISNTYPKKINISTKIVMGLASAYFNQNNIPEAEKYLSEYQSFMKDEKNKGNFISYFRMKGDIENQKKNYHQAIEYFNRGIAIFNEYKLLPSELIECYLGISKAYQANNDYKNQAYYLLKSNKIKDSLFLADKKTIEKVPSDSPQKQQPINSYITIVLIILFTALAGYFFILRKKKIAEEEMEPIENTGKELVSNEIIDKPHSAEQPQLNNTELQDLSTIIERVKNNDKSFHLKFLELYPKFNQQLLAINPQLTHLDLEYCALIKLNFDTKEIAKFKNTSINSVESRKYRIRKKLDIATQENMYVWFMNL